MFHLWDHRRFEADLRRYMDGERGLDWREVGHNGEVVLKRGFKITCRADIWRYATPVVFLFLWLVVFRYWTPAVMYVLLIMAKWFIAKTHVDIAQRAYTITCFGKNLFGARLD